MHLVTTSGKQIYGYTPYTPGRAINCNRPGIGSQSVMFHLVYCQRRSKTCCAESHGITQTETFGQRNNRVGLETRVFCVTPVARFAQTDKRAGKCG